MTSLISILTYHGLSNEQAPSENGLYTLTAEQFEVQMAYLSEKKFQTVSLDKVVDWRSGKPLPKRPIVITFDDGFKSDLSVAFPVLKRYGYQATFFVNPGTLGQNGYLTEEDFNNWVRPETMISPGA